MIFLFYLQGDLAGTLAGILQEFSSPQEGLAKKNKEIFGAFFAREFVPQKHISCQLRYADVPTQEMGLIVRSMASTPKKNIQLFLTIGSFLLTVELFGLQ